MMLPLVLGEELPATVLQVGLGAASITRFLHRHVPGARVTVVEIDPRVVDTARQFFKLPEESQRMRLVIGDGHEFVAASASRFDLIVVDGFDSKGRTGSLDTVPFYAAAAARLTAHGMMSINLLTRRRGVAASEQRLREVFEHNVLVVPPPEAGNTIALAGRQPLMDDSLEELRERAAALKVATGLNLLPTLARLTRT
jgi:spermidine synthase